MQVFCFGDSITQGFWDEAGGWTNRVRAAYDKAFLTSGSKVGEGYVSFFQLGIDGDDSKGLLNRIKNEYRARKWPHEESAFLIAIGTNDTIFTRDSFARSTEEFMKNISAITEFCKENANKVYFVGLSPVQDELLNPMPWSRTGKCYSTERIKIFDDILRSFCQTNNVAYIDIWNDFPQEKLDVLTYDGIHPSSQGHDLIANKVASFISKDIPV